MEQSLSSLAFKGSIGEAITEAKQQKKLFVVYISGDNSESNHLETSTWLDSQVAGSLSKYCILLHIVEGSSDAMNFSALYPQKAAPCITVIGYNGIQLWQHEGFVAADVLASSLEKAWLSLHIQETLLTAALASKPELSPGTLNSASPEQGSSSRENVPPPPSSDIEAEAVVPGPSMDSQPKVKEAESLEARPSMDSQTKVKEAESLEARPSMDSQTKVKDMNSIPVDTVSPSLASTVQSGSGESNNSAVPVIAKVEKSFDAAEGTGNFKDGHPILIEGSHLSDQRPPPNNEVSNNGGSKTTETEVEEVNVSESSSRTSTDVHLNIKLPDGSSLQVKLSVTDTLRAVKDHIDRNQSIGFSSYDLAVPYPRKVFSDQDLDKTLSELNLFNRQALIVVLHHKGSSSLRDQNILANNTGATSGNSEGYFSLVRRLVSYVNPFSYLGGGASSSDAVEDSQSGTLQYGSNPSLRNNVAGNGRPYGVNSSNDYSPGTSSSNVKNRKQPSSRFGSNIHTLKHDDDSQFRDGNAFWNGNSTQFGGGGNNDSK
nr:plant UBX domain-containing protein 11 isoform X1 [Ipomoea trifida]